MLYTQNNTKQFQYVSYLDHGIDVALGARELGGVFNLDKNNKVEVVPHVVLVLTVLFKTH